MRANWFLTTALASSAFMFSFANSAHAIPPAPCDEKPTDVCCEEPKPGPFAFSYPMDMNLSCPRDFYVFGDFLALQPREDGLEYAIEDTNGSSSNLISGGNVQGFGTECNSWDFDYGFRVGIGFYLNHDAWELDMSWLYFDMNQENSSATPGNSLLIPLWFNLDPVNGNQQSSARWSLTMNVLDIMLGKPYHVSRFVVFHPFFGLRAAWIDQCYTARYGGVWASNDGVKFTSTNDMWGVGPRFGINTKWNLGSGWDLLANISSSYLIGEIDFSQDTKHSTQGIQCESDFDQSLPNLEMQMGISWGIFFNRQRHHFAIQAMGEFQQWWDQLWLRKFYGPAGTDFPSDTVSRGDLRVQGVSVRFLFNF